MIWLKVKRFDKLIELPKYESEGAAAIDLRCSEDFDIFPNQRKLIGTSIAVEIHKDYVGVIKSRSGIAWKKEIDVQAGVIDSDFRSELKVMLHNTSQDKHSFKKNDRIAQMMIVQCPQCTIVEVDELDDSIRGDGSFGSTGMK